MKPARERFRNAKGKQAEGDEDGAIRIYEEILDREPGFAPALHALGVTMNRRKDFGRAAELLERAAALHPRHPVYHVDLGEVYRNLGDYRNSVGCCRTALKLRPNYPEALNTLGLALQGAGDPEGALGQFRQALEIRPGFAPAHINAGLVLQKLGETEGAVTHFRSAVVSAPESWLARTDLGLALLSQERADESLIHFQEAARLRPDLAATHHNLGNALRLLGRFEEARPAYLRAVRLNPDLAISHAHIAMTLRQDGALGEALKWFELAANLAPDNPQLWEELADLHLKREAPDQAVECRRRVLSLVPAGRIEARINLGWALQEDGRPAEALENYLAAKQIRPGSPLVHFALSSAYEEAGDLSEAEAALREALRLQPRFPAAHARLATLLRGKLPQEDLEAVERLLEGPDLNRHQRDRLLFGLAHVLDAYGEYPRAAACLREANASTLETRREEGIRYEPDQHDRFVDALVGAFDQDFFRKTAGLGLETRRPVFVVGLPRSGTTLTEQILASHPRVHGAGERLLGRKALEALPSLVNRAAPPIECIKFIDEYAIKRIAGAHLGKLNALDLGRTDRIVDKLPDNYLYLGLLAAMFPNATFIHCRRDLRDVAVSCWISDFRSVRWANDITHIGARFRQYRRIMRHWGQVFPAPVVEVKYEDTVSDLETTARRLVGACGLEWDPACLEFHRTRRVVRTASLTQVRRPIYTSSVARWKNYESELADLFALLAEEDGPA